MLNQSKLLCLCVCMRSLHALKFLEQTFICSSELLGGQSHVFKNRPSVTQVLLGVTCPSACVPYVSVLCVHRCGLGLLFLSRCAVLLTGLPVVEGQDLERGGPTPAGEAERAAGNRWAAGLHAAAAGHRYAWPKDTLPLSLFLSVCPSVLHLAHTLLTLPHLPHLLQTTKLETPDECD